MNFLNVEISRYGKIALAVMAFCSVCLAAATQESVPKDATFHYDNMTNLGIKAVRELSDNQKNTVISPLVLYNSFSMLLLGARGSTAKEIENVLQCTKAEQTEYGKWTALLLGSSTFGNEMNYKTTFLSPISASPKKTYEQQASTWFGARFGKQPDKVVCTDRAGIPYLEFKIITEAHFLANWSTEFDPKENRKQEFTFFDGRKEIRTFMREVANPSYYEDENIQALIKEYREAEGNSYSCLFILPKKMNGIKDVLKTLDCESISKIRSRSREGHGLLAIPKVKFEDQISINDMCKRWGMKTMYMEGKADFSDMWNDPAVILDVNLQTLLEISEKGTEVLSKIGIEGGVLGGIGEPHKPVPFQFLADHPFAFVIYDYRHNLPLFIGVVYKP